MGSLLELKDPVTPSSSNIDAFFFFLDLLFGCRLSMEALFFEWKQRIVLSNHWLWPFSPEKEVVSNPAVMVCAAMVIVTNYVNYYEKMDAFFFYIKTKLDFDRLDSRG